MNYETNNISNYPQNQPQREWIKSPFAQDYDFKDFMILVLIIVLVLSVLGINIFLIIAYIVQYIVYLLSPLLSIFGYTSGSIINTTSELAADTSHFGIDIAEGTAHDVGNLLIASSDPNQIPTLPPAVKTYPMAIIDAISRTLSVHPTPTQSPKVIYVPAPASVQSSVPVQAPAPSFSAIINAAPSPTPSINIPKADTTENPVQNPIASSKTQWCLIGEYQHRSGCVEVDDTNQCMSGQVFPTQQMCLNPTMTTNIVPPNNKAAVSGYYTQYGVLLPKVVYQ